MSVRYVQVLVVIDVEDLGLKVDHQVSPQRRQLIDVYVHIVKARTCHVIEWNVIPEVPLLRRRRVLIRLSGIGVSGKRIPDAVIEPVLCGPFGLPAGCLFCPEPERCPVYLERH